MLGQVVDQKFVKVAAVTAEWHRQIQHHRINRVRVHRQAIAAINRAKVQRECRRAAFHTVIVRGGEGLVQLSHCVGFNRGGQSDIGGGVGQYADVPHRAVRPVNGDLPRLRDAKALLWIGDGGHRGVARYGLRHAQRAYLAVQTQGDVRAERHLHRPRRDVVQVKHRLAGIGGRRDPAFPDGASRQRSAATVLGDLRDRPHAQDRSEQQGHDEHQQGHEPQPVRIAVRHAQVRLHRAGGLRGHAHPRLMRLPHSGRGRIGRPDRLRITHGRDRTPRQGGVNAGKRLVFARPAEHPQPAHQGGTHRQSGNQRQTPEHL